jgi:DNA-binding MurR/RpiR family transcriptional regulator
MAKESSARIVKEHKLFTSHTGHANHMCELVAKRQMDKAATLAKGAKYICHICGRASARATNVCEPVEI